MYESKFLEKCVTFAEVVNYVDEQYKEQHLLGIVDFFESSYSPNRSFFYGKLNGALRLFLDASLIKKEALSQEDIMHNKAVRKECGLLHMICYTLYRNGREFHPFMPNELQFRYRAPTLDLQNQFSAYRNKGSFKEAQEREYEAQFLKIGQVLANEEMRILFEEAIANQRISLSFDAHNKFQLLSKALVTEKEALAADAEPLFKEFELDGDQKNKCPKFLSFDDMLKLQASLGSGELSSGESQLKASLPPSHDISFFQRAPQSQSSAVDNIPPTL